MAADTDMDSFDAPPLAPPQRGGGLTPSGDGVSVCFQNAGHILGSAYVEEKAGEHMTVFSGDLGSSGAMFVEPPVSPARADILVLESTYGDKVHTQRTLREQHLADLVNKALADHGTLLISAFSLGRTQELLAMLEHLLHTGKLNWPSDTPLPVILDSPLASELTSAYRSLNTYWPQWLQQRKAAGRLPLAFDSLISVTDHREHKRLVKRLAQKVQPAIVIAASGMCQGGRIVNYLQALAPLPTTDILFVGYQARGTLGAALQRGDARALARAGIRDLRAQVHTVSGFSAHADREDLLAFVGGIKHRPGEVRLVHGDASAKVALQQALMARLGLERVLVVR